MSDLKFRTTDRILSIVLIVFIVISSLPVSVNAADVQDISDHYSIQVLNEKNRPVKGAKVTYTANKNNSNSDFITKEVDLTTDKNGIVLLGKLDTIKEGAVNNGFSITYEVTCDQYESVNGVFKTEKGIKFQDFTVSIKKDRPSQVNYTLVSSGEGNGEVLVSKYPLRNKLGFKNDGVERPIKISANEGSYIKSVEIICDDMVDTYNYSYMQQNGKYFEVNFLAIDNVTVNVEYGKDYNVKITQNLGGVVNLNDERLTAPKDTADNIYKSDEFTEIFNKTYRQLEDNITPPLKLEAKVYDGYIIDHVRVNNDIYYPEDTEKKQLLLENVIIDKDLDIEVCFVKSFRVTVSYTSNGNVVLVNESDQTEIQTADNQAYCFPMGSGIRFVARPDEDYCVLSVQIDKNKKEIFKLNEYTKDKPYSYDLPKDKNHKIQVEFAERLYSVECSRVGETAGKIGITKVKGVNKDNLSYAEAYKDDSIEITVTPEKPNHIVNIMKNQEEVDIPDNFDRRQPFTFPIDNLDKDYKITAEFAGNEIIHNAYSWNSDAAVRNVDNIFLFNEKTDIYFNSANGSPRIEAVIGDDKGEEKIFVNDGADQGVKVPAGVVDENGVLNGGKFVNVLFDGYKESQDDAQGRTMPYYIIKDTVDPEINNVNVVYENVEGSRHVIGLSDMKIDFKALDPKTAVYTNEQGEVKSICSGLADVEYIINDENGNELEKGSIYQYTSAAGAAYEGIKDELDLSLTVSAEKYNQKKIFIILKVKDRTEREFIYNVNEKLNNGKYYYFNTLAPTIRVEEAESNLPKDSGAAGNNYNSQRAFKVIFEDNDFNADKARECITIEKNGADCKNDDGVLFNVHSDNRFIDIVFCDDGEYKWNINKDAYFSDNQKAASELIVEGNDVFEFTVDTAAPFGTIGDGENTWEEIQEKIDFNIWKNASITVIASVNDDLSGVKSCLYYKTNEESALTSERLEELYKEDINNAVNANYDPHFVAQPYTVKTDEHFTIYARVTDNAGNVLYLGTNGYICDLSSPKPVISIKSPENNYKQYNDNVKISISVAEEQKEGILPSGIRSVKYVVNANGVDHEYPMYQFKFNKESNTYSKIYNDGLHENVIDQPYDKSVLDTAYAADINIKGTEYNTDDITVTVFADDNAGNGSSKEAESFDINIDKPTAVLSFDNNAAVTTKDGKGYFSDERTARITITDRGTSFPKIDGNNAAAESFINIISVTDADGNDISDSAAPEISKLDSREIAGTDKTEFFFTVKFSGDANYVWEFAGYINNAGSSAELKSDGEASPYTFTVDKTAPLAEDCEISIKEKNIWKILVETLSFGLFAQDNNNPVDIKGRDSVTPVEISYYIDRDTTAYSESPEKMLKNLPENKWTSFEGSELQKNGIDKDNHYVIFARIQNYCGLPVYISTDGYIIDTYQPEITVTPLDKNGSKLEASGDADIPYYSYNKEYSDGIKVSVSVNDSDKNQKYSGIRKIEWWTEGRVDNELRYESKHAVIFNEEKESFTFDELKESFEDTITIDPTVNNYSDTLLCVRTIDNAGNESNKCVKLDIDITSPEVSVVYSGQSNKRSSSDPAITDNAEKGFFTQRSAAIEFKERDNHFNKAQALESIKIAAKDYQGQDVNEPFNVTGWTENINDKNPDETTHTVEIRFDKNANYNVTVDYSDTAGNNCLDIPSNDFTVDNEKPEAKLSIDNKNIWEKLAETLTFGIWRKEYQTVKLEVSDKISPIKSVYLYKENDKNYSKDDPDWTGRTAPLNRTELEALFEGGSFVEAECENGGYIDITADYFGDQQGEDQLYSVYARIADNAGNVEYFSTEGIVVDKQESIIEITPEFTEDNSYGDQNKYFHDSFDVIISVDETAGNTKESYSGIKNVKYIIDDGINKSEEKVIYDFEELMPENEIMSKEKLVRSYHEKIHVNVDPENDINNVENLKITVKVEDNSGNISTAYKLVNVNASIPMARIEFDNNDPYDGKYYTGTRKAKLIVYDRSDTFAENTGNIIRIEKKDKNGTDIKEGRLPEITWSKQGDDHIAEFEFSEDGNYTWSYFYTNKAGLSVAGGGDYTASEIVNLTTAANGTKNVYEFTLDNTAPTGTISTSDNTWTDIIIKAANILTFNIFAKDEMRFKFSGEDKTGNYEISPINISYYVYSGTKLLSKQELDNVQFIQSANAGGIAVSANKKCSVYIKVQDSAGNYSYIGSQGVVLDNAKPKIDVKINTEPAKNNIYTGDIKLTLTVTEPNNDAGLEAYSGIKTLEYQIYKDGKETQSEAVDLKSQRKTLAYDGLMSVYTKDIVIDSKKNNSSNVRLLVKASDYADNKADEVEKFFDIDITDPVISVEFEDVKNPAADSGYFKSRKAKVTIKERNNHFSKDDFTKVVTAKKLDGKNIDNYENACVMEQSWTYEKGNTPDEDTHTAVFNFKEDANYNFTVNFTDRSGRKAKTVSERFTKDAGKPNGSVTAERLDKQSNSDSNYVRTISNIDETFELSNRYVFKVLSRTGIKISQNTSDIISGIKSVKYYIKTANDVNDLNTAYTVNQLENITDWKDFNEFTILPDTQCMVYLKIMDKAGNISYLNTNALIVDSTRPVDEEVLPRITVTPQQPVNGIYNTDVVVKIKVDDPKAGGTYSGLNKVWYEVYNRDSAEPNVPTTAATTLYSFDTYNPTTSQLKKTYEGSIVIDSTANNSNNVQVVVYAMDNAGNMADNMAASSIGFTVLKIDKTAPVIDISYDNNTAEQNTFFNKSRKATIRVTERNFDPDDVNIRITNTDGTIPKNSEWTRTAGTLNQDNTVYTSSVLYDADGDYKFEISFKDRAGNECKTIRYAQGTVASNEFTIDKTAPKVSSVTYDNDSASNGNYYKAKRTATVTVNEHNFDPSKVSITIKGTDDGNAIAAPKPSEWRNSGDLHTADIAYNNDGYYTFDISLSDKAGNKADEYKTEKFYIDTKAPVLNIAGVENESANSGKVAPVITYSDTNFDMSGVVISFSGAEKGSLNVSEYGKYSDVHNGKIFTFSDLAKIKENDDIYTLSVSVSDKAGNKVSKEIRYSVNRKGSTFEVNTETKDVSGKCINDPFDIVVSEINVDKIDSHKVIVYKNHESSELKENENYKVEETGGNGKWYKYTYTIFKDNFDSNGDYSIEIKSTDKAKNYAVTTNDDKNLNIQFTVDKKKPEISFQNIESGATYAEDSINVKFRVDELNLSKVEAYIDNECVKTWEGKDLDAVIKGDSVFDFDIPGTSTSAHIIKAVAFDRAGNSEESLISGVYVTTNLWIRFINNKPVFFGTIGGVIGLAALIVFIVVLKRRKKAK